MLRSDWPSSRPVRPAGWGWDGLLLAAFVALTVALANGRLLALDLAVRDWFDRRQGAHLLAVVLNKLGQGGMILMPLSALLAAALIYRTRSLRPALPIAGAFVLTALTIGPLKYWLVRGYPHRDGLAHPERLFSDPAHGSAYPSGHVANAIVWYGVIALLVRAVLRAYGRAPLPAVALLAIRIAPPAILFATTTYLGYHWLTDAVAGLLLGLLLDRLLSRVPWDDLPLPARLRDWGTSAALTVR